MAKLEQLLEDVSDAKLRAELEAEVAALKGRTRFGLVYERHLPETVVVGDRDGLKPGDHVRPREEANNGHDFRLVDIDGDQATILSLKDGKERQVPVADLLTVRRFGDPTDVGLTPLGATTRSEERPYHAVIDGENFHVLQLLTFVYQRQVDLIYIDPPYNTGAKDWTYNNRFVDANDAYRHSKWLSMMEKRLKLAKRLLKPDGVLIVTIDEHEVHHLGLLLEELFPDRNRQMVTIVINPKGVTQGGLSRVEEHAIFVYPEGMLFEGRGDDLLTPQKGKAQANGAGKMPRVRWQGLLHSGEGARRQDRPNMFYPVLIDEEKGAVVRAGEPLLPVETNGDKEWPEPDLDAKIDGYTAVWPVRSDGSWGRWYLGHKTLTEYAKKGYVALGGHDPERKTWALSYPYRAILKQVAEGVIEVAGYDEERNVVQMRYVEAPTRRLKTVWHRTRHDAGAYGADLLGDFLGARIFPFPKSLYATRDTLAAVVGDKPDALILDFFAGSGTTLHATLLLNHEDAGRRRCILVTNNEVDPETRAKLKREGHLRGTPEYEARGIFEAVTRPRVEAAITGKRKDGSDAPGAYLDERPYAEGFDENVEFFRLDYLDGEEVELGACFDAVHPLLWLAAGGRGERPEVDGPFLINPDCGYAVLFEEDAFRDFEEALAGQDAVTHVAFVTDSEEAYAEMRERVGAGRETLMLYRDFLRHYRRQVRL
ncbi:MAG: site-specific DNA-methyltransferase [Gaiella sp.]|nr:site-specific DNA-methyltransferase [Gaiella sp.]